MKAFCWFATVFTVLAAASMAAPSEEQITKFKQTAHECKESVSASDDDWTHLLAHERQETAEGKCMVSCIYDKLGVIQDGKLNSDTITKLTDSFFENNDNAVKVAQEIAQICSVVQDDDPCEFAEKIRACKQDEFDKRNINYNVKAF